MGKVAMIGANVALFGALTIAGAAGAQRGPGAGYPPPAPNVHYPPLPQPPVRQQVNGRWGSKVGGRWWGGVNAPGGWNAYRAPQRGWRLPSYWVAPRFYVNDWSSYGFPSPPQGYYWTRYYDDAVLIDGRGQVFDTVGGVDWDRYDGDAYAYDGGYADGGYRQEADGNGRYARHDGGATGAVAGAVVGGVAGNVIAGRGNRLGGTLIGAGVGAAAGYAIGHDRDRDRMGPPPPPPGAGYREPLPPPHRDERIERRVYAQVPGPAYPPPGAPWVSGDGRTTVTVTTSGAPPVVYAPPPAVYGYGYGYGQAGTTTVTVQTAPVVTTTTTEIVEDSVTYSRPVVRRVYRKRVWHPRPRPAPRCACGS